MKLIRFGPPGQERPGVLDSQGRRRDCSAVLADWRDAALADPAKALADVDLASLPAVPADARWAAPVPRPWKVIGIGLNYRDHAAESGMAVPTEPVVFMKASNTVVGPYDDVLIPRGSTKTDWEVELAVVIGRPARYLDSPDASAACVAGYCVANDVSERAFQLERAGQWTKGKSCDTFTPLGPWLATPDEIADPQNLALKLSLNGQQRQNGNTATMVFGVAFLVHYLSQVMTLEAGDVIVTGTPPGVGLGCKPPVYLKAGDVMELSVEHLGTQRQTCRQA